ncbi:MAG: DUF177 domain-containing protein [Betaproteobacteria bacterium]|nr:DUF177 domain-containing protein [Betaproteobacteria bacterium]
MSQQMIIDLHSFTHGGKTLQGEFPVVEMVRVHDLLAEIAGALLWRVEGSLGKDGRPQLRLSVEGELSLRCQRCLGPIAYPLQLLSVLEFVPSLTEESDLTAEELEDDSRDFLPMQKKVDLMKQIEDEVLLALPVVPRHDECEAPAAAKSGVKESPFAVLEQMREKQGPQ